MEENPATPALHGDPCRQPLAKKDPASWRPNPFWVIAVFIAAAAVGELLALQIVAATDPLWLRVYAFAGPPVLALIGTVSILRGGWRSKENNPRFGRPRLLCTGVTLLLVPALFVELCRVLRSANIVVPPWFQGVGALVGMALTCAGGICLIVWLSTNRRDLERPASPQRLDSPHPPKIS
jgi:hypothetical protein